MPHLELIWQVATIQPSAKVFVNSWKQFVGDQNVHWSIYICIRFCINATSIFQLTICSKKVNS